MILTKEIQYQVDNVNFQGFIAYNQEADGLKPCVLIAHDWSGRRDFFCEKAKEWAAHGYVGFAIDMFGEAKQGDTTEEKQALIAPLIADRSIITTRMVAALTAAHDLPMIDKNKIAATGYCFGGLCVLDLARSGAEVNGVVSFHGLLNAPEESLCAHIRAKVLVLHGYEDPMAPPSQVQNFAREMTDKKVDWQIHLYGNVQHAFTNPQANDANLGLRYNEAAAARSQASSILFLEELFKN